MSPSGSVEQASKAGSMADFLSSPRISKQLFHNLETIKYTKAEREERQRDSKRNVIYLTADSSTGNTKPRERLLIPASLKEI